MAGVCVCACVRKLIDEEQLFMECQALHIPTLMFLDATVFALVCVSVW